MDNGWNGWGVPWVAGAALGTPGTGAFSVGDPLAQSPETTGAALPIAEEMPYELGGELTETHREHIIMRCKDARSMEEVRRILREEVPDGGMSDVYEHGGFL